MALKDRLRRALPTSSSPSSSSTPSPTHSLPSSRPITATNSGAATPTQTTTQIPTSPPNLTQTPTITLTKTASRLSLTKSLTWSRDKRSKSEKLAEKNQKRIDFWMQKDRDEWSTPEDGWRRQGKGKRSKQHQDLLRAFEFSACCDDDGDEDGFGRGRRRRSIGSWVSGISPGQSRCGSLCGDAEARRKRSAGVNGFGGSALSREVSRDDSAGGSGLLHVVSP